MEHLDAALDEFCINIEEGSASTGRMGRRSYDDTKEYKSKNLKAERRRRQKLSDRLLNLRALVPRITNMNKATIVEDAITYIQELQKNEKILQEQLCELELKASSEVGANPAIKVKVEAAEEMKKNGIQVEVEVTQIDRDKLWVKIIFEKKRGGFTTLMEAMSAFGFEFINTNVTTSKGAMLVSSCVKGIYGEKLAVQQTRELLLQIINGVETKSEYC